MQDYQADIDVDHECNDNDNEHDHRLDTFHTYHFNELHQFGYNDEQIHNAFEFLQVQHPSIVPEHPHFVNSMLDTLQQAQWMCSVDRVHEHEEDEKVSPQQAGHVHTETRHVQNTDLLPLPPEDTKNEKTNIAVHVSSDFDVEHECQRLHDVLGLFAKKKTTQSKADAFIQLILRSNTEQRQSVKQFYKKKHFINLDHYISRNFSGVIKRMLLYAMQTRLERNAYLLRVAIKKQKNINVIAQILCTLDSEEIHRLTSAYNKGVFRTSLRSQTLKLSADNLKLRAFLTNLLDEKRAKTDTAAIATETIQDDVRFLNKILSEIHWGNAAESRFINIFSTCSFEYLRALCIAFERDNATTSLIDACHNALGIEYGLGYAVHCVLLYVMNSNAFYGKLMNKGMKFRGHKYMLFWRVIIDRMDMDLKEVLAQYRKSDVDAYNFKRFIDVTLCAEDDIAADFVSRICNPS